VDAPVATGAYWICSVRVCPGFKVAGSVPPVSEKPVPAMVAEFTVNGALPLEVNVRDCVFDVLTVMLPKLRLVLFTVN